MILEATEIIKLRSYVNGQWIDLSSTGDYLMDPNTGEQRQAKCATEPADIDQALQTASDLHSGGLIENSPLRQRLDLLHDIAEDVDAHQDRIAIQDSMNTGVPISTTRLIASTLAERIRTAAREMEELGLSVTLGTEQRPVFLLRKPLGPALVVAPWNAPTFTMIGKVAAAMAAGCPVILKPSENAPGGCQIVAEIIADRMLRNSYPAAAFQLVHGGAPVGALLTADSRIEAVSFTGGGVAGRSVAKAAAENLNPMQMELGSNNPVIILADVDVQQAARSIAEGMTRLNGQWCEAPGKILIHESVHDVFVEQLRQELSTLPMGHCLDEETQVGPLAFERHLRGLQTSIERLCALGGRLIPTQDIPEDGGWFMAPGIIIGCHADDANEELFGPVVTVHKVSTEEEAIRHANAPGGGLDAYVFGRDVPRALRIAAQIHAGEVRINGTLMSDLADGSQQTFWGSSGIGGHGPNSGVRFFIGDRVIGVDRTDLTL